MSLEEEVSFLKKQNEILMERLNFLDSRNLDPYPEDFSRPSSTARRPSVSSALSSTNSRVSTNPDSSSSRLSTNVIPKPKKRYITKEDIMKALKISNESYMICVTSMRTCAAYHLDYNLAYKDIHKSVIHRIVEKFKFKIKHIDPPIPLGFSDWFAFELLKKHVQHVRDNKTKTKKGYFKKRKEGEEKEKKEEESEVEEEVDKEGERREGKEEDEEGEGRESTEDGRGALTKKSKGKDNKTETRIKRKEVEEEKEEESEVEEEDEEDEEEEGRKSTEDSRAAIKKNKRKEAKTSKAEKEDLALKDFFSLVRDEEKAIDISEKAKLAELKGKYKKRTLRSRQ